MNESKSQKWGGFATLYKALAYIVGIVGFVLVVNISEICDPMQKVAAIDEKHGFLSLPHLVVDVF